MAKKYQEFALALSGGGARGIVHAGFLKALDEAGLKPAAISGTSMGAIVGSMYASGVTPDEMMKALKYPDLKTLPSWLGFKAGIGSLEIVRKTLEQHIGSDRFEDLKIPLIVAVTNLNRACVELINTGNLYDAVIASSSIPVIFMPQKIGAHFYVDGGLTMNMPVKCLKKEGRMIIGINSNHIEELDKQFTSMKQVGERCLFIAVQRTLVDQIDDCDLFVDPAEARMYGTFEFEKAHEIFEIGYNSGKENIPQIKAVLATELE
jgi:NTE family protein